MKHTEGCKGGSGASPTSSKKVKKRKKKPRKEKGAEKSDSKGDMVVVLEDPWKKIKSPYGGRLSTAEEFARLRKMVTGEANREANVTVISKEDFCETQSINARNKGVLAAQTLDRLEALAEAPRDGRGLFLRIANCNVSKIDMIKDHFLTSQVVVLECPRNEISELGLGGPNCFLRRLDVSANKLAKIQMIGKMDKLVELDISSNPISTLPSLLLKNNTPNLRALFARACELDSSALNAVAPLAQLEELDLSFNKIGDLVLVKTSLTKQLTALWFEGNPISELEYEGFLEWVRGSQPCMRTIDGRAVARVEMSSVEINELLEHRNSGSEDANVQDSASCSCVEGNPCLSKYNCIDWDNRFKVAEDARREVGFHLRT